jgi:hypothetical protein
MKISTPGWRHVLPGGREKASTLEGEHGGRGMGDAFSAGRPDSNLNLLSGPPVIWQGRSEDVAAESQVFNSQYFAATLH